MKGKAKIGLSRLTCTREKAGHGTQFPCSIPETIIRCGDRWTQALPIEVASVPFQTSAELTSCMRVSRLRQSLQTDYHESQSYCANAPPIRPSSLTVAPLTRVRRRWRWSTERRDCSVFCGGAPGYSHRPRKDSSHRSRDTHC